VIRFDGTVHYHDERRPDRFVATQAEVAAWELYAIRHGLNPTPQPGVAGSVPVTWSRFLGYEALRRTAGIARADWPDFADWSETVAEVDLQSDDETGEVAADTAPFQMGRLAE
jgi:hypothetical protein